MTVSNANPVQRKDDMASRLPIYHETAGSGRGTVPKWWFGAPFIAVLYVFLTPRYLPDLVAVPEELSGGTGPLRFFVGLLIGVAVLVAVQVVQWVHARIRRHGA